MIPNATPGIFRSTAKFRKICSTWGNIELINATPFESHASNPRLTVALDFTPCGFRRNARIKLGMIGTRTPVQITVLRGTIECNKVQESYRRIHNEPDLHQ